MLPYVTSIRGIDVSDRMVDKYNAEAREAGMSEDDMYAVRGDVMAPAGGPLEGQDFFDFDLIIMSLALHHVDDPNNMLAKLVERLKPDGRIMIIDWLPSGKASSHAHGEHRHEHAGEGRDHDHKPHPAAHTISFDGFSKEQMESMLKEAGCSSSDYVLAKYPSQVPHGPNGEKHLFFAKGTK